MSFFLIQDPDTGYYTKVANSDAQLIRVHSPGVCADRGCAIHNHPSDHPLNEAPLTWENDTYRLARICHHQVAHPDVDSAVYLRSIGADHLNIHTCDGCCVGEV